MHVRKLIFLFWIVSAFGNLGCTAGGAKNGAPGKTQEGFDPQNSPKIFGLKPLRYEELAAPKARRGAIQKKPWTDSYWPYTDKNVAWRYATRYDGGSGAMVTETFASADDQIANALANPGNPSLSPSEKFDLVFNRESFALTREAWSTYSFYHDKYGDDTTEWSWMGICNGWAPASIAEEAPKNAVLAIKSDGQQVLFFEGDLRGLIAKAYDLNATQGGTKVIGSRCDAADGLIPRDSLGRPVDGRRTDNFASFAVVQDYSLAIQALEVTSDPLNPKPYWIMTNGTAASNLAMQTRNGTSMVYIYNSQADVVADAQSHTYGRAASGPVAVDFYKACRDANPASLHLALVQMVSDAATTKSSFVIERSRTKQVWNHPLWGFTSSVGGLTPVQNESASRRIFRSPGTVYTVPIETRLVFVSELGPLIRYEQGGDDTLDWRAVARGDTYSSIDLSYTLELDAAGYVIGGEWQESPDYIVPGLDFFWQLSGPLTDVIARTQTPSMIKYSDLRKLLDCSQRSPEGEVVPVDLPSGHLDLPVVRCPI